MQSTNARQSLRQGNEKSVCVSVWVRGKIKSRIKRESIHFKWNLNLSLTIEKGGGVGKMCRVMMPMARPIEKQFCTNNVPLHGRVGAVLRLLVQLRMPIADYHFPFPFAVMALPLEMLFWTQLLVTLFVTRSVQLVLLVELVVAEVITAATNEPNVVSALTFFIVYGWDGSRQCPTGQVVGVDTNTDEWFDWMAWFRFVLTLAVGSDRWSVCCEWERGVVVAVVAAMALIV